MTISKTAARVAQTVQQPLAQAARRASTLGTAKPMQPPSNASFSATSAQLKSASLKTTQTPDFKVHAQSLSDFWKQCSDQAGGDPVDLDIQIAFSNPDGAVLPYSGALHFRAEEFAQQPDVLDAKLNAKLAELASADSRVRYCDVNATPRVRAAGIPPGLAV